MQEKPKNRNEHGDDGGQEEEQPAHIPRQDYFKVANRLIDYWLPFLGKNAFVLYMAYLRLYNPDKGYSYPSIAKLAKVCHMTRAAVVKANTELEEYGLIEKVKGAQGRCNRYTPKFPYLNEEATSRMLEEAKQGKMEPLADPLHLFRNEGLRVRNKHSKKTNGEREISKSAKIGIESIEKKHSKKTNNLRKLSEEQQTYSKPVVSSIPEGPGVSGNVGVTSNSLSEQAEEVMEELVNDFCKTAGISDTDEAREFITSKLLTKWDVWLIREKIQLLAQQRNVINPKGWLVDACRRDFKDTEEEEERWQNEAEYDRKLRDARDRFDEIHELTAYAQINVIKGIKNLTGRYGDAFLDDLGTTREELNEMQKVAEEELG